MGTISLLLLEINAPVVLAMLSLSSHHSSQGSKSDTESNTSSPLSSFLTATFLMRGAKEDGLFLLDSLVNNSLSLLNHALPMRLKLLLISVLTSKSAQLLLRLRNPTTLVVSMVVEAK